MDHGAPTPEIENISVDSSLDAKESCVCMGLRWIDLTPEVDQEIIELIDAELAVRLRVLPLEIGSGRLVLAMLSPEDIEASDEVGVITGYPVTRCGMEQSIFSDLMRKQVTGFQMKYLNNDVLSIVFIFSSLPKNSLCRCSSVNTWVPTFQCAGPEVFVVFTNKTTG